MNRTLLSIAAGLLVFAGTGCVDRAAQEQGRRTAEVLGDPVRPIRTETVATRELVQTLEITGDVTATQDTTVGAKSPGRIVSVYVKDGDTVAEGQLLATLDQVQARAQLSQAQAQVGNAIAGQSSAIAQLRQAQSQLVQAGRNAQAKPTQSAAAVRQAQAQVQSARAQLEKALAGARPEERRQAEATVASARTNLDTQEAELARVEKLVREGAIAANRLDQQRAATANARSQFQNAQEALRLIQNGTRDEDIAVARAAVRQAEEALATARSNKALDPLLQDQVDAARAAVEAARAQVASARAQVDSAQAQVKIAQEALADTEIRAPFAGKISGRPEQPGTIAGAQTVIARIVGGQGIYFSGQLPSSEVVRVQPGMPVDVTVSSVPGRTFQGQITAIAPLGSSVARLFDVRIALPSDPAIRPGMYAGGRVTLNRVPEATVVPERAIVRRDGKAYVFVDDNGKAKRVAVTTGLVDGEYVQVSGIEPGAKVVVEGQTTLTEGAQVKEDAPPAGGEAAPAGEEKSVQ
jgi:RND family efflux transporter MFP subunit